MTSTHTIKIRPKKDVLWSAPFTMLIIVNVLTNIGFGMLLTSISLYAVNLGASLAAAGSLGSVFSLVALLMRPLGGRMFDRFDKRNTFIISTLVFGGLSAVYAVIDNMPALFVVRILHGVAFSLSGVSNMALISCFISKSRMSEGFGYYGAGLLVGQAIAPTLVQFLIGTVGFSWLYIIVALSIMIPPLFCFTLKIPQHMEKPAVSKPDKKRRISFDDFIVRRFILYALVGGVFSFYNGIANSFMLLIGEARQIQNISLFFTVSSVVLIAVRLFIGKLSDNQSLNLLVIAALISSAVSILLCSRTHLLSVILVAAFLKALGQGVGQVALQSEVIKRADPAHIGIASGTIFIGNDLGNTLGPALGGLISDTFDYSAMFYFGAFVFVIAIVAFVLYQKSIHYRFEKPSANSEECAS